MVALARFSTMEEYNDKDNIQCLEFNNREKIDFIIYKWIYDTNKKIEANGMLFIVQKECICLLCLNDSNNYDVFGVGNKNKVFRYNNTWHYIDWGGELKTQPAFLNILSEIINAYMFSKL